MRFLFLILKNEWESQKGKDEWIMLEWGVEHDFDYDFVKRNTFHLKPQPHFFLVGWNVRQHQAKISEVALPQFLKRAGLQRKAKASSWNSWRRSQRQWDYPFGAPHQMLLWKGLIKYGYFDKAQEVIYRWLWLQKMQNITNHSWKIQSETSSHKVLLNMVMLGLNRLYISKEGLVG
jgi:alpha,alpha-trehalase